MLASILAVRHSKHLVVKQSVLPQMVKIQVQELTSFHPILSHHLELVQSIHLLLLYLQRSLKIILLISQIPGLLKASKDYQSQVHRRSLSAKNRLILRVEIMEKILKKNLQFSLHLPW
uniref:Alternative protein FAM179B n=1 Tax=Homo sapiens TaxID=9606 RepID=L0R5A8_HUMAN|nr:alternative protein FAM179B [Homo sapiens]